jgi:hypothetical protein
MPKNIIGRPIPFLAILSLAACPTPKPPYTQDKGDVVVLPQTAIHSRSDCPGIEADVEPNGSLFSAVQLPRDVCTRGVAIPGRLASPDDADLFALPMNSGCSLPFRSLLDPLDRSTKLPKVVVKTEDVEMEVCLFGSCDYGLTVVKNCTNAQKAYLEEGMLGCCLKGGAGTFFTGISCDSYSPSFSGFLLVKSLGNDCHTDYKVDFSISEP